MEARENYLRTVEFRDPEWIPCRISFLRQVWRKHRERLVDLILRHPAIFPNYQTGDADFDFLGVQYRGNLEIDEWKCTWRYIEDGMTGQVVGHPMDDWSKLAPYQPPDYPLWGPPDGGGRPIKRSWSKVAKALKEARREGRLACGSVPHGFMFMRLQFLRGYKNVMMDFAREDPRLQDLIDLVLERNLRLIDKWLDLGPLDVVNFGDDLGTQDRLPVKPDAFRKYMIPAYRQMFSRVRDAGTHVHLHSDGYFMEVMGDLIDSGVTILNPQDGIHGIDNLKREIKGKVCIDLDIDRQQLLPRGNPDAIMEHIRNAVEELGSQEGGLMLLAGVGQDVPLQNVEALCRAMERYRSYWSR